MKRSIALILLICSIVLTYASCVSRGTGDDETTMSKEELFAEVSKALAETNVVTSENIAVVRYKAYTDHAEVVGCDNPVGVVEIQPEYNGLKVTAISANAFEGLVTITSVIIPEGVEIIGEKAFLSCGLLSSVNIPNSVTTIGRYAFYGCSSLEGILLGRGVNGIGLSAFSNCASLKEIKVDADNTSFCDIDGVLCSKDKTALYIYPTDKQVSSYTLPDSVKLVWDFAFAYTNNLETVKLNKIESLGGYAFSFCRKLTEVDFGDSKLTKLGTGTFQNATALKSIVIPEGITQLGSEEDGNKYGLTFYGCSGLAEITLPGTLTDIYSKCFEGCTALANVRYNGTKTNWSEKVNIGEGNAELMSASLITK